MTSFQKWRSGTRLRVLIAGAAIAGLMWLGSPGPQPANSAEGEAANATASADKLFADKNYKDAAAAYQAYLATAKPDADSWKASNQLLLCWLRLQLFDNAEKAALDMVKRFEGRIEEARAERMVGNLYLQFPHYGTIAGGKYLRAQYTQGRYVQTNLKDRDAAIKHLERARDLYSREVDKIAKSDRLALDPKVAAQLLDMRTERVESIFDLAAAASRFTTYDLNWYGGYGEELDDAAPDEVGESDGMRGRGRFGGYGRKPVGIPVDLQGKPIFDQLPAEYSDKLPLGGKVKYLLHEAERLDPTKERSLAARAVYRRAMLARARYGADRLRNYWWYDDGTGNLQQQFAKKELWQLADNQVLTLLGSRLTVVDLPKDEDVLALLDQVIKEYPQGGIADEARYARALYFQTRKQFTRALAEYALLSKDHPNSKLLGAANSNIEVIKAPEGVIQQTGVQLAGEPARLQLTHRNITKIDFVARELDIAKCLEDLKKELEADPAQWRYTLNNLSYSLIHEDMYKRYLGKEVAKWSSSVKDDETCRYATTELTTPLTDRGCYYVEGTFGGHPTRFILLLQDIAIVEKSLSGKTLYWITDARTGKPVSAKLDFFEFTNWYDNKRIHWYTHRSVDKTNDAGMLEFSPRGTPPKNNTVQIVTIATTADGRMAFSGVNWWNRYYNPSRERSGARYFATTDRPVYRPGQDVKFKVWARTLNNGEYTAPVAGANVHVQINDPRGNKVLETTLKTDAFGGVDGSFTPTVSAPLGMYHVMLNHQWSPAQFRVEEYKKPEFEVTVDSGKSRAKLGEKVDATIKAWYYFGAPVTEAVVNYKVFRTTYTHMYTSPGEWDWLYGWGYGRSWYAYDWFPGWGRWAAKCCVWYPWWGQPAKPERELVLEGESEIGKDGTVKITLDTAAALKNHPDQDHRYSIEAEVRDASRRTITGSGTVTATRQEFYAFVENDRGWYRPGEQAFFKVRTLTADNSPRSVKGKVTVAQIAFQGENGAKITENPIEQFDGQTDAEGNLSFSVRVEKSGQFKVSFETKDAWNEPVAGASVIWCVGNDFDGKLYRFTDLEILSDKRSYKVGETAKLMINTKHAGSTVLFSDSVDNGHLLSYRLLHLPNKSTVIEVPVRKGDVPNFFVEATTVRDGKVHGEIRELAVPPEQGMVKVTVSADKSEYRPGTKGKITLTATDLEGKPVSDTQFALAAFDKSVLYIQSELTPDIRQFFWGNKRHHNLSFTTSLGHHFTSHFYMRDPQSYLHHYPDAWYGSWGVRWANFAALEEKELQGWAGGGGFGNRRDAAAKSAAAPGAQAAGEAALGDAKDQDGRANANGLERKREGGKEKGDAQGKPGNDGGDLVEATVRSKFADTALWAPAVKTDAAGKAVVEIDFPENLTAWKIKAYGMTTDTRVGSAETQVVTNKNLLVRLQAPRFFVERDEVVLSANVHNYLKTDKLARVSLKVDPERMQVMSETVVDVKVSANGEKRVDWVVKVISEGAAKVQMTAQTDEESDAMAITFPVLVHGIDKMVAAVGSIRPNGEGTKTISLEVPEKRKPSATKLEVRFSPSLAGAMIDALPYLVSYPYGCTEQTMSRFLPTVVTAKTLQQMGIKLEDVAKQAVNLNAQEINKANPNRFKRYAHNPVFDTAEMNKMIQAGLERLYSFQQGNGGWGWWRDDKANPYLTAYVLYGLVTATECDVAVRPDVIQRGFQALQQAVVVELAEMKAHDVKGISDTMAFTHFVLSMKNLKNDELRKLLFERRDHLALYGKALLCLAEHKLGDADKAKLLLKNIMQYREEDKENETVWFRTPQTGWWYWYNGDIETNAYVLKALTEVDPKSDDSPRLVKWLLNNRAHGTYWRSTRDTAITVQAMGQYIRATGETEPDYTLHLNLDGKPVKSVKVNRENFFTFDNTLTLEGEALTSGKHTLTVTREGKGAVYFSSYLSYFTKEDHITSAGLELKVERKYFKLERVAADATVQGARGQDVKENRIRWKRIELKNGDQVLSGDLIQVELKLISKNAYEYLCFEDYKAAGCEPVDVKSGARFSELCSNMELRDDRVVFFVGWLAQGEHLVSYRVRAEIPGTFHALPTKGFAMYNPELNCNSDEMLLKIKDK